MFFFRVPFRGPISLVGTGFPTCSRRFSWEAWPPQEGGSGASPGMQGCEDSRLLDLRNIGALIVTYAILGVPTCNESMIHRQTLF